MDPGQVALGVVLGVVGAAVVLAVVRGRPPGSPVPVDVSARRLRRIDATEAYVAATVTWLFDRAVGNRTAVVEFDTHLVGVPFGQVELRLLSREVALEYAGLCRWLWGRAEEVPEGTGATERQRAFRRHLHEQLDGQRALAESGRPSDALPPDIAATVGQVLDEVMAYRAELVRKSAPPPPPSPG